ncbi:hypothetical protein niasHT_037017 [Heterodera trifolii]|uniref:BTB/POZ domain-containing protein n=1 Tax=Heterodera trifolii TaxID=157864 RepID=A0ABD2IVD2_9BILA
MYVMDRMYNLLSTGIHADVYFLVGEAGKKELLPAHKLILSSASDVFEAMFRFDAGNEKPTNVIDVEVGAFKTMLSFIYTDDLSELNGNNVIEVLYAAKKYNIPLLVNACVNLSTWKLTNVFHTYSMANFLDEKNLLCYILERDQLRIDMEIKIWRAALRWADEKCRQNGIDCSAQNQRAMLGPALFKIRFALIPHEEFVRKIVPSGLLSQEEMDDVFLCNYQLSVPNLPPERAARKFLFPAQQRFLSAPIDHKMRISTACKIEGQIMMKIKNFSGFASAKGGGEQFSKAVYVKGLPWRILALSQAGKGTKKSMGFFLHCDGGKAVDWSCKCSASLRILSRSQNEERENFTRRFDKQIFNPISNIWGFNSFITFKELMDTRNGLYNKKNTVTLGIQFTVEDEDGGEQQAMEAD